MAEARDSNVELIGYGVSAGIVLGTVLLVGRRIPSVKERAIEASEVSEEIERFKSALTTSQEQLEELKQRVSDIIGENEAAIFDAHIMLLADRGLAQEVINEIQKQQRNAEYIFQKVIERYSEVLKSVDDSYIRDRLADVEDVVARVIRNLQGREDIDLSHLLEPRIVVAHDLSPSDTAKMDRHNVIGFATAIGSRTSHTAIMARAMGIPAIVGLSNAVEQLRTGDDVILDGTRGVLIIRPDEMQVEEYQQKIQDQERWFRMVEAEAKLPAETIDGFRVQMSANVELPEEVETVKQAYGVGIGLFRTEFLFVTSSSIPTEEEQFQAYRRVVEEISPQSVIFRTLDIGGDKFLSHLNIPSELNPFLGMRAIRFSLSQPELFMSQLRAILRASAYGKVRLMFPMIATLDELLQALDFLQQAEDELDRKGIDYNRHLDVGIMIEVPAAAILAEQLARHVDFLSVGTNDLVQYSLAVDRANPDIAYLYQPSHPAIVHLLQQVVRAAYAHGRWVSLCGEMAAEPVLVPLILGLGIHELSMSPVAIGPVKRLIRRMRMYEAEDLVRRALGCASASEVWNICEEYVQKVVPDLLTA